MSIPTLVAGDIGRRITLTLDDPQASFEGASQVTIVAWKGQLLKEFAGEVSDDNRSVSYTTLSADDFPAPGVWHVRFDASFSGGRRIRGDDFQTLEVVR